MNIPFESS